MTVLDHFIHDGVCDYSRDDMIMSAGDNIADMYNK